jgi:general secretion pathway protein D
VLIKVLIAEVSHDNSLDLGVEFSAMNLRLGGGGFKTGTDFGVVKQIPFGTNANTGGFFFTLNEENVVAAIHAIATKSALDVLSRPYILTGDNQLASIMVGQSVPFITNSTISDTGQVNNTIVYNDIGIILNVTPHINPVGIVTLDVAPQISALTATQVPISSTVGAPVIDKRAAQARVAIRDGQTIVIGGLMGDQITNHVDKVPFLGDVPLLGLLFQHSTTVKNKTELLIFLTPHVAQQPDELKGMSEDELAGAKILKESVDPAAVMEHIKSMSRGAATHPAPQDSDSAATGIVIPETSTDANSR